MRMCSCTWYWVESAALQLPIAKRVTPLATAQTDNALMVQVRAFPSTNHFQLVRSF